MQERLGYIFRVPESPFRKMYVPLESPMEFPNLWKWKLLLECSIILSSFFLLFRNFVRFSILCGFFSIVNVKNSFLRYNFSQLWWSTQVSHASIFFPLLEIDGIELWNMYNGTSSPIKTWCKKVIPSGVLIIEKSRYRFMSAWCGTLVCHSKRTGKWSKKHWSSNTATPKIWIVLMMKWS